mgnify:CR=1 FL=1
MRSCNICKNIFRNLHFGFWRQKNRNYEKLHSFTRCESPLKRGTIGQKFLKVGLHIILKPKATGERSSFLLLHDIFFYRDMFNWYHRCLLISFGEIQNRWLFNWSLIVSCWPWNSKFTNYSIDTKNEFRRKTRTFSNF